MLGEVEQMPFQQFGRGDVLPKKQLVAGERQVEAALDPLVLGQVRQGDRVAAQGRAVGHQPHRRREDVEHAVLHLPERVPGFGEAARAQVEAARLDPLDEAAAVAFDLDDQDAQVGVDEHGVRGAVGAPEGAGLDVEGGTLDIAEGLNQSQYNLRLSLIADIVFADDAQLRGREPLRERLTPGVHARS